MNEVYVIHAEKHIGGRWEAYPLGCKLSLEGAQNSMARYVANHKLEVAYDDEWTAEETSIKVYNMMTEIVNERTANQIIVRIYKFETESTVK